MAAPALFVCKPALWDYCHHLLPCVANKLLKMRPESATSLINRDKSHFVMNMSRILVALWSFSGLSYFLRDLGPPFYTPATKRQNKEMLSF